MKGSNNCLYTSGNGGSRECGVGTYIVAKKKYIFGINCLIDKELEMMKNRRLIILSITSVPFLP